MAKILITGSTGYVGSRLIQNLKTSTHELICTARTPEYILDRLPKNAIAKKADFNDDKDHSTLFKDCDVAFFLIHSLGEKEGFEAMEAKIARNFVKAAAKSSIQKIIYLGGLIDESIEDQSPHMRSRKVVGDILRQSNIPVFEFRASVILGPGSTSFELIRALVERLPVMVTPKWVKVNAQPIYIENVIDYLTQAINDTGKKSKIIEIGGTDIVSYKTIMDDYAKIRHLKRFMIPIPFLTPYLSSLWLGLVTPVYARVGRKLIDSIKSESIVKHPQEALTYNIQPLGCYDAILACLEKEDQETLQTSWAQAQSSSINAKNESIHRFGNRIIDSYKIKVPITQKNPFKAVEKIGGETGWYYLNGLWKLRGYIDLLVGGIGLRRGRRDQNTLIEGDILDWWRVERFQTGKKLVLKAEMKLPGRAWLEFELITLNKDRYIQQTVIFDPLGLFGLAYWYSLLPLHIILFKGMLKRLIQHQ